MNKLRQMLKLKMYYRWLANYSVSRISRLSSHALPPRILSIETTEQCNLGCVMCPRNQTTLTGNELTLEQFKYTLSLFPSVNTVILLGRGETFMMRDIIPILEFGSYKNIQFTIITNGTMLDAEKLKRIPNIGKIIVSIDHPRADAYSKIRKGSNLDTVISNLKALKKAKPHQWLCIQGIIMKSNIDFMDDFVRLAKNVSADSIKLIQPMIFDDAMGDMYIEPSYESNLKIKEAKLYAKKLGIRFVAVPLMSKPRVCVEPWLGLRVSLKGDIYPCCYINNSNESSWNEFYQGLPLKVLQSNYVMGSIYSKSIKEMWNGRAYRSLRNYIINIKPKALKRPEELNALRGELDISARFSYCSVCLFRENKAC